MLARTLLFNLEGRDLTESVAEKAEALFAERWGALRPKYQDWPPRIRQVLHELDLWLAGEAVEHMQVAHKAPADSVGFLEHATELSLFVLTERFAVLVTIPRQHGGPLDPHTRLQVKRDALTGLRTTIPPLKGLFEGLTFELTYESFPRDITIKLCDSTSGQPDYEFERAFFARLRDDYFAASIPS